MKKFTHKITFPVKQNVEINLDDFNNVDIIFNSSICQMLCLSIICQFILPKSP